MLKSKNQKRSKENCDCDFFTKKKIRKSSKRNTKTGGYTMYYKCIECRTKWDFIVASADDEKGRWKKA